MNSLTHSVLQVYRRLIVGIHWTPPIIFDLNLTKSISSKKVYSKHICGKNLKISIKMPPSKTLGKTRQTKNWPQIKVWFIPNEYFQACWRIIPISYRGQQAQTQDGQTYICASCLTRINRKDSSASQEISIRNNTTLDEWPTGHLRKFYLAF